jgi:hypothetical protein
VLAMLSSESKTATNVSVAMPSLLNHLMPALPHVLEIPRRLAVVIGLSMSTNMARVLDVSLIIPTELYQATSKAAVQ